MPLLTFELLTASGYLAIGIWIGYTWRKRSRRDYREKFERQYRMWLERESK